MWDPTNLNMILLLQPIQPQTIPHNSNTDVSFCQGSLTQHGAASQCYLRIQSRAVMTATPTPKLTHVLNIPSTIKTPSHTRTLSMSLTHTHAQTFNRSIDQSVNSLPLCEPTPALRPVPARDPRGCKSALRKHEQIGAELEVGARLCGPRGSRGHRSHSHSPSQTGPRQWGSCMHCQITSAMPPPPFTSNACLWPLSVHLFSHRNIRPYTRAFIRSSCTSLSGCPIIIIIQKGGMGWDGVRCRCHTHLVLCCQLLMHTHTHTWSPMRVCTALLGWWPCSLPSLPFVFFPFFLPFIFISDFLIFATACSSASSCCGWPRMLNHFQSLTHGPPPSPINQVSYILIPWQVGIIQCSQPNQGK